MTISALEKELFLPKSAAAINSYNFSECLSLLKKLQQLDSLQLQSPAYQHIIGSLEERIKRLAESKTLLIAVYTRQPGQITLS